MLNYIYDQVFCILKLNKNDRETGLQLTSKNNNNKAVFTKAYMIQESMITYMIQIPHPYETSFSRLPQAWVSIYSAFNPSKEKTVSKQ